MYNTVLSSNLCLPCTRCYIRNCYTTYLGSPDMIWVRSWRWGCLVTWFCYQVIAKPGNKTAAPPKTPLFCHLLENVAPLMCGEDDKQSVNILTFHNRACHPGSHYQDYYPSPVSLNNITASYLKIMQDIQLSHRDLSTWQNTGKYCLISNISCTKSHNLNYSVLSWGCLCPIHWSLVLSKKKWRCSWNSADRQCSSYIWVVKNFIPYKGVTYIRGLTVAPVIAPRWHIPLDGLKI